MCMKRQHILRESAGGHFAVAFLALDQHGAFAEVLSGVARGSASCPRVENSSHVARQLDCPLNDFQRLLCWVVARLQTLAGHSVPVVAQADAKDLLLFPVRVCPAGDHLGDEFRDGAVDVGVGVFGDFHGAGF